MTNKPLPSLPLGYRWVKCSGVGYTIETDPDRAPAIRRVFREIAAGRWSLNWAYLWLKYEADFFTRSGGCLSERKLKAVLRDPFYCGRPKRAVPVRYRPLVGSGTFDAASAVVAKL